MNVEARLAKLGLALPKPTKPVGNYQPWILSGNLLYLSGQFPIQDGKLIYTGRVVRNARRRTVTPRRGWPL